MVHWFKFQCRQGRNTGGIYCSVGIPLSLITSLTCFSFSLVMGILLHTGSST